MKSIEDSERRKILFGFVWKFAERISSQLVSFVISIILARILLPTEYGTVALINVFIVLANVFITNGFSTSLIQNKDAKDIDFTTNMYLSIAVASLLYIIIFFLSPLIAYFFSLPELCTMTRVYALSVFLLSYNGIQNAWISRHLSFKKMFGATLIGNILSGLIGIYLALSDYGAWALVAQYNLNILFNIIVLSFIVPWRPSAQFSLSRGKKMFDFGSKMMVTGLLGTGFNQLRQIIIGKFFSPVDLAFFNRAHQFPSLISNNLDATISQVLFPVLSNHSDNPTEVNSLLQKSIKVSSFLIFGCMVLLAIISYPLIRILLTEKWIACTPYMQIMCIDFMLASVANANSQAIKAMGMGNVVLKNEMMKKPVFVVLLLISIYCGMEALVWSMPIYSIYASYINMLPNKKILGYSIYSQVKDYAPAIALSLFVSLSVIPISYVIDEDLICMVVQIIVYISIYLSVAYILKMEALQMIIRIIRNKNNNYGAI